MPKTDPTPGNPIITLWGVPPVDHPIALHPMVRWLCRAYERTDQSHVLPPNPTTIPVPGVGSAALIEAYRIGHRLAEHAAAQVALGASMSSLSMFVQNLGYGTSTKTVGTPLLCKAPDDKLASGSNPESTVYSAKAADGTLSVETSLVPIVTMAGMIRDRIKTELQARGLTAFGYFDDDCEDLHAPWNWCWSGGGNWSVQTGDARAATETLCRSTHAIAGGGNLTLNTWIAAEEARNASFAPDANVSWNTGTNLSSGSTAGILRLRAEAANSQHAHAIIDTFLADAFFSSMECSNYAMIGADNASFPDFLQASGSADTDHLCAYLGQHCHSPVFYAVNESDGTPRTGFERYTGPGIAHDLNKNYNMKQVLGVVKRKMTAITQGSAGSRPVHPWVRGIDNVTGAATPSLSPEDMSRIIRTLRTWPTVRNIILWFNDSPTSGHVPDYDAMYAAINEVYPV